MQKQMSCYSQSYMSINLWYVKHTYELGQREHLIKHNKKKKNTLNNKSHASGKNLSTTPPPLSLTNKKKFWQCVVVAEEEEVRLLRCGCYEWVVGEKRNWWKGVGALLLWWLSNEHEIEVVEDVLVAGLGFCWLGKKEIGHGFFFQVSVGQNLW
jgi:hypothetical protein